MLGVVSDGCSPGNTSALVSLESAESGYAGSLAQETYGVREPLLQEEKETYGGGSGTTGILNVSSGNLFPHH